MSSRSRSRRVLSRVGQFGSEYEAEGYRLLGFRLIVGRDVSSPRSVFRIAISGDFVFPAAGAKLQQHFLQLYAAVTVDLVAFIFSRWRSRGCRLISSYSTVQPLSSLTLITLFRQIYRQYSESMFSYSCSTCFWSEYPPACHIIVSTFVAYSWKGLCG